MNLGFGKFNIDSGKIIIRNVVDGYLHFIIGFSFFVFLPLLIATIITREKVFFVVGIISVILLALVYVFLYIFFAFTAPDRLQTEKYQIQKQKLLMYSKNNDIVENKELVFDVGKTIPANIKDEEVEEKEGA